MWVTYVTYVTEVVTIVHVTNAGWNNYFRETIFLYLYDLIKNMKNRMNFSVLKPTFLFFPTQ